MDAPVAVQSWPHSHEAPDDVLSAVHTLELACQKVDSPAEPARSASEVAGWFRSPPRDETRSLWLLSNAGTRPPSGMAWLSCRANGTAVAWVVVGPVHRRTGIGRALLELVRQAAIDAGMWVITGATTDPSVRDLLVRRGATSGHVQVRQVLDLTKVPRRGPAGARALPAGVAVVFWVDAAPDELLDAYATARDAINDAPMAAFEREVWTSERIRDLEHAVAARGMQTLGTALVEDGRMIGYSEVRVSRVAGSVAATQDTAVVRDRRRLGCGALLKAVSLDHVRATRSDVQLVTTSNEETNLPMLRINSAVGFIPVARHMQLSMALVPHDEAERPGSDVDQGDFPPRPAAGRVRPGFAVGGDPTPAATRDCPATDRARPRSARWIPHRSDGSPPTGADGSG